MGIHSASRSFTRPAKQTTRVSVLPAPVKGIDGRVPLAAGSAANCIYTYNITPSEYGMRIRDGYREWVIDVPGFGVRTLMPFEGPIAGAVDNRLFAVSNEGIFNVSAYDTTPTSEIVFTDQSDVAGYGTFTQYTTDGGDELLLYADSANGLFQYSTTTDAWTQATGITGPVAANINYVVAHKQRIWLVERDATRGWYLGVGAITGAATSFNFGYKFAHGGSIAGMYSWTVDGGEGVDDYLVVVSRAGDVVPYKGDDPSSADTWSVVGTYFIGAVPAGHRGGSEYGGSLHLLSVYGVVSLSDLLRGVDSRASAEDSISYKIARYIRDEMELTRSQPGWEIRFLPAEGILIITSPQRVSGEYIQYIYNLVTEGWGFWRDLPIEAIDTWQDDIFFGTEDGRVMVMDVSADEVLITPPVEPGAMNGVPVEFSILTNYQTFDSPGTTKRGVNIRANFIGTQLPNYTAKFVYDYQTAEIIDTSDKARVHDIATWDSAIWDVDKWVSGGASSESRLSGSFGMGRTLAVAMRGTAIDRGTLISFDVMWNEGGAL